MRQIVGRSLLAVTVGLAAGSLLALVGGRLLRSQLFGVGADDLRVYVAAGIVLLFVSLIGAGGGGQNGIGALASRPYDLGM